MSSLFASPIVQAQPLPQRPLVAAASDLAPIYGQTNLYPNENKSVWPVFSFGSSAQLVQQVVMGAPFEMVISANAEFLDPLYRAKLADPANAVTLAYGRLALWSKSGKVTRLEDLLQPSVQKIGIANPKTAPYGLAAKQVLESAGLWQRLSDKMVFAGSVRQTVQFAETGNVDAILTSVTLARELPGSVTLPANLHQPLALTAVPIGKGVGSAEIALFLAFLRSKEEQARLASYGLQPAVAVKSNSVTPGKSGRKK